MLSTRRISLVKQIGQQRNFFGIGEWFGNFTKKKESEVPSISLKEKPKEKHRRQRRRKSNTKMNEVDLSNVMQVEKKIRTKKAELEITIPVRNEESVLEVSYESGKIGILASGCVWAKMGQTVVMTSAVSDREVQHQDGDFMPLSVDYREKYAGIGAIPKNRLKRELMPTDDEILRARVIDRAIRPMFPQGYLNSTQVMATLQAYDGKVDPMVLTVNSASAALAMSDIPWNGPIGCVRIGFVKGEFVVNPDVETSKLSTLDLLCAGTTKNVVMIESAGDQIDNDTMRQALGVAKRAIKSVVKSIKSLDKVRSATKKQIPTVEGYDEVALYTKEIGSQEARDLFAMGHESKMDRQAAERKVTKSLRDQVAQRFPNVTTAIRNAAVHETLHYAIRSNILNGVNGERNRKRFDGRSLLAVRKVMAEQQILPGCHGSALFSRGDTQALCTVTLGSKEDSLSLNSVTGGERDKDAMLQYEFPPYCVNETGRLGPNRRSIGHGNLAEKAILPILPSTIEFPYTIRMNSEVTMSDGSSSMATACGVTLALLDAQVPIKAPIAGVSIGLVTDGNPFEVDKSRAKSLLLVDILGTEDHFGDMDFKIAGSETGITAMQLDVKLPGISYNLISKSLDYALDARKTILKSMLPQAQPKPKSNAAGREFRVVTIKNLDVRKLIGLRGSNIQRIQDESECSVHIIDSTSTAPASIHIHGNSTQAIDNAEAMIEETQFELERGNVYPFVVKEIRSVGATVEGPHRSNAFLHISQIQNEKVTDIHQVLKVGQNLDLLCVGKSGDNASVSAILDKQLDK